MSFVKEVKEEKKKKIEELKKMEKGHKELMAGKKLVLKPILKNSPNKIKFKTTKLITP